ncbi:hypothetical protein N9242_00890 [Vicingaceae bacterium]|nr:hypothetical protein [Vicingaceae bacterium]
MSFNDGLLDIDGNPITIVGTASHDLLLDPFYATERDILSIVMDEPTTKYIDMVREMIFNSSIMANDKITNTMLANNNIDAEQGFRLKRQYVICLTSYDFYKTFYRDYMKSIKKSKFLGDVKVSLDVEKDPSFIVNVFNDAKECYLSIENILGVGLGMSTFSKGVNNACNYTSDRQWFPGLNGGNPRTPIAANKAMGFCSKYKIGVK